MICKKSSAIQNISQMEIPLQMYSVFPLLENKSFDHSFTSSHIVIRIPSAVLEMKQPRKNWQILWSVGFFVPTFSAVLKTCTKLRSPLPPKKSKLKLGAQSELCFAMSKRYGWRCMCLWDVTNWTTPAAVLEVLAQIVVAAPVCCHRGQPALRPIRHYRRWWIGGG